MIYAAIGHRGAGKTSFVGRVESYFREEGLPIETADLDQLIEAETGKTVSRIFDEEGEARFRSFEREVLARFFSLHRSDQKVILISLGAGCEAEIPGDVERIWVRRPTDPAGRIFLDRPRLDSRISAIDEYRERFHVREHYYESEADHVWTVLEGFDRANPAERRWVLSSLAKGSLKVMAATITVLASHARPDWLQARVRWEGLRFELRDDLLDDQKIETCLGMIPKERVLYSLRKTGASLERILSLGCAWDWPLELGDLRKVHRSARPTVLSLHERDFAQTVRSCGERLEAADRALGGNGLSKGEPATLLKLAVETRSFSELRQGWAWACEDPARRSFLPISRDGRWSWFRLLGRGDALLGFVREGAGSALDQPTLAEVMRRQEVSLGVSEYAGFAALLGDPVLQSRTPAKQSDFFSRREMPVFAIRVAEGEWDEALPVLRELGLRAAAVTSPLKVSARGACQSIVGPDLGSVNTLFWCQKELGWIGANTDLQGLEAFLASRADSRLVAVWGGGGTLEAIRTVLPNALLFSARSGLPRSLDMEIEHAEAVIWAVGRDRAFVWPPASWRPREVVDLNYAEDSPGREYAMRCGARYVSGLAMFEAQAQGQREFWERVEPATSARRNDER